MRKKIDLLLIALSSPIQIGIYYESKLIETIQSDKKSSDILPILFDQIIQKYDIKNLFYANGPGSFMAIKVAYIFLKTMSVTRKIPLYATDAFKFNKNSPIKAIGKLYFVNITGEIETKKLDLVQDIGYELPKVLDYTLFSTNSSPIYAINAVG